MVYDGARFGTATRPCGSPGLASSGTTSISPASWHSGPRSRVTRHGSGTASSRSCWISRFWPGAGRGRHSAHDPVPAPQAFDRLFAGLTRSRPPAGARRNRAAASGVKDIYRGPTGPTRPRVRRRCPAWTYSMLFMRKTAASPSAGRSGAAGPRQPDTDRHHAFRQRPQAAAALFRPASSRRCLASAASGAQSASSGNSVTASMRPPSAMPADIRPIRPMKRSVRPHRSYRSGAGRVRSEEDLLRAAPEDVLGKSQPDAGHAPGQRCRHPDLARRSTPSAMRSARPPMGRRQCTRRRWRRRVSAPSPPRSRPRPVLFRRRLSIWRYLAKNPAGYCGLGGTGVSCPSASA